MSIEILSEKEKMLKGEPYQARDPELVAARQRAHRLTRLLNQTEDEQQEERRGILKELFGTVGNWAFVEPPFRCEYGFNIHVGEGFFTNFDVVLLDICPITMGWGVLLGAGTHIYTVTHPLDAQQRMTGIGQGAPVTIGNRVWVGGRSVILPGVTIGDNAVIGAGSIVNKDVPANVVVAGNPARIIKTL
ncbi:MAG TPA: sugar O-acetyltransferase [Ktedonobacteraceae bacterium]|jgi:maltose O-acetyltransferase|nr:sugar O-acetyltransferase [Ktedonobacteraceae bacterium]